MKTWRSFLAFRSFHKVAWQAAAWTALACGAAGCASSAQLRPETQIAAAIQGFQRSADSFVASRRQIAQFRRRVLSDTIEDTARWQAEIDEHLAIWSIAGDCDKADLYKQLLAATTAQSATVDALDKLIADNDATQTTTDTKANFRSDKLSSAAQALVALGTKESLKDLATFYVKFGAEAAAEFDKQRNALNNPPTGTTPDPKTDASK